MSTIKESNISSCPICSKEFTNDLIEIHVNRCIFLNTREEQSSAGKRLKLSNTKTQTPSKIPKESIDLTEEESQSQDLYGSSILPHSSSLNDNKLNSPLNKSESKSSDSTNNVPLAEKMRPNDLSEFIGQEQIIGKNSMLRNIFETNEFPSMILWGPPGCGKTTLANIIASNCKKTKNLRFVKVSATMAGVNDVRDVIKVSKNEKQFSRQTVLFMDEIHRFNKLQQDIFLPHVENGTIILIGATTENPSFSLNSALLSRCRVIVLEKLSSENVYQILKRALSYYDTSILEDDSMDQTNSNGRWLMEKESMVWLADMCDGDARIALNSLQIAMSSILENHSSSKLVSLDTIKEGLKKSHLLYDRKGDQHYDMISALHKSIRASDDNASLYWCTRIMLGGEDPRYICRRMVRAASEDIGLADPNAVNVALSALNAVQLLGMPEADCIVAQCAIYLARAPKNSQAYLALCRCKKDITEFKGPLPSVPLPLRNAPSKLMRDLGYSKGYNLLHKDKSGLHYMPSGMEKRNYFN